ncbi:uncharacterized protein K441DRAFT_643633 [Cenococcum geophilum 1.58]|uniref:uncharacterized protein n=1 Tax=Cenococcum geophilum 1.58 TaxID=794803 RepID=UPI00358DFDB7|nr:hypothetical protein K441DRAFT_643633 [Cenococcum geophilum 1.58]
MPPKRRSSGPATRSSTQSTLAFHGATNKVTKPTSGTRSQKKDSLAHPISSLQKADLSAPSDPEPTSPTTVEAAILEQAAQEAAAQAVALTPEEEEASHVTEARIKKYWAAKEDARMAPRVHQQALGLHEKVLREWDTSGQYGPCIGVARMKRWKRAHRLGLNPPLEVLAVLLKEQEAQNIASQRAHVDELMNSRFGES